MIIMAVVVGHILPITHVEQMQISMNAIKEMVDVNIRVPTLPEVSCVLVTLVIS